MTTDTKNNTSHKSYPEFKGGKKTSTPYYYIFYKKKNRLKNDQSLYIPIYSKIKSKKMNLIFFSHGIIN